MNSEKKPRSIEVTILGQKYSIRGDAPEERIRKLAAFVDAKMKEVHHSAPGITPLKAAIIAALDITDEMFRQRDDHEKVTRDIEEKADALTGLFD